MTTRTVKQRKRSRAQARAKGIPVPDMYGLQWPSAPQCECGHGGVGCPLPATRRVTAICQVEGCDCAAAVFLACTDCTDTWVRKADADPSKARLRVRPL